LISVCKQLVLSHSLPPTADLIFHAIFALALLTGALSRSDWYQKGLVLFNCGLFVFYIVLLYARMQLAG